MKATITRPDGTKVELESVNTDDVVKAVQALSPVNLFAPAYVPSPWRIEPYPWPAPLITWTTTTATPEPA